MSIPRVKRGNKMTKPPGRRVAAISFLLCCLLLSVGSLANGAYAEDVSNNHTYPNEALEEFIEVRADGDDYNQQEAQAMIDRLGDIPESMIRETLKGGAVFLLVDTPITDQPEFEDIEGEIPRGWEDTGKTWNDVPGVGGATSAARIGYSNPGEDHASSNLEYHEVAHAIDGYMLDYIISDLDEFQEIHEAEQTLLFPLEEPGNEYYDNREEYFAEALSLYYLGGKHKQQLEERAPETYDFIHNLERRLLQVHTQASGAVDFAWKDAKGATHYEIYRDGDQIHTTTSTNYTDTDIDQSGNYEYEVKAIGKEETLYTTFSRNINVEVQENESEEIAPDQQEEALETPDNLKTNTDSSNLVILYWDPVIGADYYEVRRNEEIIDKTEDERYLDRDLGKAKTYHYSVRAVNRNTTSDWSSAIQVEQPYDPPGFQKRAGILCGKYIKNVLS